MVTWLDELSQVPLVDVKDYPCAGIGVQPFPFSLSEVIVEATDVYLQLVLVRRVPWRQRVKEALALRPEGPVVLESAAEARPVAPRSDL